MVDAASLLKQTVAEMLEQHPETALVFTRYRMGCVGCGLAAFEPVAEAVAIYYLKAEPFAAELARAIQDRATAEPTTVEEKSR